MACTGAFQEVMQRHHATTFATAWAAQRAPVHVESKGGEAMVTSVLYAGTGIMLTAVGVPPVAVAVMVTLLAEFWPLSAMLYGVGGHTSIAVTFTDRVGCPEQSPLLAHDEAASGATLGNLGSLRSKIAAAGCARACAQTCLQMSTPPVSSMPTVFVEVGDCTIA